MIRRRDARATKPFVLAISWWLLAAACSISCPINGSAVQVSSVVNNLPKQTRFVGGSNVLRAAGDDGEYAHRHWQASGNDDHDQTEAPSFLILSKSIFVAAGRREAAAQAESANSEQVSLAAVVDEAQAHHKHEQTIAAADGLEGLSSAPVAQIHASSLFDEDPVGDRGRGPQSEVSLIESITNQTRPDETDDANQESAVDRLEQPFLSLFDELWLIKNASAEHLARLNYFTSTSTADTIGQNNNSFRTNCTRSAFGLISCPGGRFVRPVGTLNNNSKHVNNAQQLLVRKQEQVASQRNVLAGKLSQAASKVNGWFSLAQLKLTTAKEKLKNALVKRVNESFKGGDQRQRKQADQIGGGSSSGNDELAAQHAGQGKPRRKRNVEQADDNERPDGTAAGLGQPSGPPPTAAADCNRLTLDEENKCRSMEARINSSLNYSFPGTPKAIEENCRHVSFLLSNCWVQQLAQLRMSLSSRNESLLLAADAATATSSNGSGGEGSVLVNSCGLEPSSPQYIRDRVSWLWLNLCIDRRFRQGYVHNLRCLANWNQPRAQKVCGHEYNRMQNYLMKQANGGEEPLGYDWAANAGGGGRPAPNDDRNGALADRSRQTVAVAAPGEQRQLATGPPPAASGPQPTMGTGVAASQAAADSLVTGGAAGVSSSQLVAATTKGLSESELVSREISSKMLCCMFDQFLRCVHKQANRDCGRSGAQFVIDFMSRIGTDDMKYLCNADSKGAATNSNSRQQQQQQQPVEQAVAHQRASYAPAPGTTRRPGASSADTRNPFIENNYCVDPRIQSALASFGGASADSASGQGSKPAGRNRQRPVSYDPAYFETFGSSNGQPSSYSVVSNTCHYYLSTMTTTVGVFWLLLYTTTPNSLARIGSKQRQGAR
jgi:hypothetical protein